MKTMSARTTKCQTCNNEAVWAMQPFGPDNVTVFTTLGSHYRGFPVIPVCDEGRAAVYSGRGIQFWFKGKEYWVGEDSYLRLK